MRKFLLQHKLAPGDVLVMSALIRDIQLAYPETYQVSVDTSAAELWINNPHVTAHNTDIQEDLEIIKLGYTQAIEMVGSRNWHFLYGFYEDFEKKTGIHVPLLYPRPDYHLSEEEKNEPLITGRYWVVLSGGKNDFITKHWHYKSYQQVVNILRSGGIHCVQLGAIGQGGTLQHFHPRLENCLCLVGLTTLRDMARIIYHAEGVICPVTLSMHMAAALEKPCVVIAGGREEWWWEAYVPRLGNFGSNLREDVKISHKFLHTIGQLDCCKRRGCWRNTLDSGKATCKYPLQVTGQILPKCMSMITVNHVIEAIMAYYDDGILPPIGTPRPIVIKDGKICVLKPGEVYPEQPKSALVDVLTYPVPQLIKKTAGLIKLAS